MSVKTSIVSGEESPQCLLDTHAESFLFHLRATGYAERTIRKKRPIVMSFVGWTKRKRIAVKELNDSNIVTFTSRLSRKRNSRRRLELAVLRLFLGYLRSESEVPYPPAHADSSLSAEYEQRYTDYLRNERGLAENSILVYSPYIHDFLIALVAKTGSASTNGLDAQIIQDFLIEHIRDRSGEYARLLSIALRSFLRFIYLRGETTVDLSLSIPRFQKWRQAAVPPFLSSEDVERVLAATDQSTPCGRRDYAILLLLARLGLRPGEIVKLDLDDIRWRTGEIIIHGKGKKMDRLPLLADIGEKLALYLRKDRSRVDSRRVFLRMWAPPVGFSGPATVGHIASTALARAGIRRTGRGAAHLFRHSLATKMIRQGASLAEISEVLRHRSQNSTEIYAKVDFEALRSVARPWPGTGGAK